MVGNLYVDDMVVVAVDGRKNWNGNWVMLEYGLMIVEETIDMLVVTFQLKMEKIHTMGAYELVDGMILEIDDVMFLTPLK